MRQFIISCLILLSAIASMPFSLAALDSKGKDFFVTFNNNSAEILGNLQLYISSEEFATGTVSVPGFAFLEDFTVQPNESIRISVPKQAQQHPIDAVADLAVRITADKEVKVYGLNQRRFSTDGFLGLPVDVLGVDYSILGYEAFYTFLPAELSIVAPYDQTEVVITPKLDAIDSPESDAMVKLGGVPFTVSLNRGQTYSLKSNNDLTGTTVSSNRPIGVMSSVDCAIIPVTVVACDHIVEMMPPVSTWGDTFLSVPLATRRQGDVFRVLASEDGTAVKINGLEVALLGRGEYHEMILKTASVIEANQPVLVSQYSPGQYFDRVIADPFMMLLPPAGQYLDQYTFEILPKDLGFEVGYVNVVIRTTDIPSLVLDNLPVDPSLFQPISNSGFSGAQILLTEGVHNIAASVPFGISVYGFGRFDSYGYPGGMAFERINPGGDSYEPYVKLMPMGNVVEGIAGDFEDLNLNGLIDLSEDLNGNNILDRRTEDLNGNNQLDVGEDSNGNGLLDRDTGVFGIELESGAQNLLLSLADFVPGSLQTNFTITLGDASLPGSGVLVVTDGAGNEVRQPININDASTFQNVRIISTLSGNDIELDESTFATTPNRIQAVADITEIEWRFADFEIDQVEDLNYEVILKNPVAGETRLVTQSLLLSYLDANGDEVRRELGEQTVEVSPSVFTVQVATDKPQYTANETVLISPQIGNLSGFDAATDVRLRIETESGELVSRLGLISGFEVAANSSRLITGVSFNTVNTLVGNYVVIAELLDESGRVVLSDEAPFEVIDDVSATVTLRTTTDKSIYHTSDTVEISDLVRNLSVNRIIRAAELAVQVIDPTGVIIFERLQPLSDLTPSASQIRIDSYSYTDNAVATYRVQGQVFDSQGVLLASDSTSFEIVNDLLISLVGDVTVSSANAYVGDMLECLASVSNLGSQAVNNLDVRHIVVEFDSQQPLQLDEYRITLDAKASNQQTIAVDTSQYDAKQYACILQANIDGQWQTLDFENFELSKISINANAGSQGRVLILLDDQHTNDGGGIEPALVDQRAYLENLLTQAGWSYTIVTEGSDFLDELRTGQYSNYMLLSESEKISEQGQKELREAVFGGAGFIEAGSHDQRQGRVDDALGIKFKGKSSHVQGISLFDSVLLGADNFSLSIPERVLTGQLQGASKVAEYIPDAAKGNQVAPPAITMYEYGLGQSVYVGFDLLAEASLLNVFDSVFAQLILNSLNHVNDEELLAFTGLAYPVTFVVSNQGEAMGARLLIDLPDNVTVADAPGAIVDANRVTWAMDLQDDGVVNFTAWLRLPADPFTISATVESGIEPNWIERATTQLTINPLPVVNVNDVLSILPNSKQWKQIRQTLQRAQGYLNQQDWSSGLRELLKAADKLANSDLVGADTVRIQLAYVIRHTERQL